MIHNPEAPATRKQLWLLHILTKEDTRAWQLTMQEASDKIGELKGKPQVSSNGYHYCVMYSIAPSTHRMSNGGRKWRAFYTTKDKRQAMKRYNEDIARYQRNPSLYPTSQVVLVECKKASLARAMLERGDMESKFAKVLKDSRNS